MDQLVDYAGSGSEGEGSSKLAVDLTSAKSKIGLSMAPAVEEQLGRQPYTSTDATQLFENPTFDEMYAPVQGPGHPLHRDALGTKRNTLTGTAEDLYLNDIAFREQYYTFQTLGYAMEPGSGNSYVGNRPGMDNLKRFGGKSVFDQTLEGQAKLKRQRSGKPGEEGFLGPWAPFKEEGERRRLREKEMMQAAQDRAKDQVEEVSEIKPEDTEEKVEAEEEDSAREKEKAKKRPKPKAEEEEEEARGPLWARDPGLAAEASEVSNKKRFSDADLEGGTSIFHGKQFKDYQGRTYITAPSDVRPNPDHQCYLPKTWIHTWAGHNKGVAAVRLFPGTGHLVLSAGLDCKVKIWDVYRDRKCLRTFMGHIKALKDICFNHDGTKFITCSYDRWQKLWDTETGQVIGSFSNKRTPYCIKLNPEADKENQFLVGCSDKKIYQWDMRAGKVTEEYDSHLGAVNTLTFVDDNRRFVSTSDDKSIRIWDYGIPVQIKYICEPHMHSISSVSVHPEGQWMACQSMDNQILIYGARDRFRLHKRKRFVGHLCAGYSCQVNFSPDGKYVVSGDGDGRLFIWDWKSTKLYRMIHSHTGGPCVGVAWHPVDPSRVVTCGWDGKINYYD